MSRIVVAGTGLSAGEIAGVAYCHMKLTMGPMCVFSKARKDKNLPSPRDVKVLETKAPAEEKHGWYRDYDKKSRYQKNKNY